MKVLIFYASTGGGHKTAAKAIYKHFSSNSENEITMVDCLKEVNIALDKLVCLGYEFLATKTPGIYGAVYQGTAKKGGDLAVPFACKLVAKSLLRSINKHNPDIILTTHAFASQMLSYLKEIELIKTPVISILTDYTAHCLYNAPNIEAFITPCENTKKELIDLGINADNIYDFGIPVSPDFYKTSSSKFYKIKYNLPEDRKTLLLMAGSFGVGTVLDLYKQIEKIDFPLNIVVITGNNDRLYSAFTAFQSSDTHHLHLVKFTDKVFEYMALSDILITKPGALTITEAIESNLPMIVYNAIPGQEEENASYLTSKGAAIYIKKASELKEALNKMLDDDVLENMKNSISTMAHLGTIESIEILAHDLIEKAPIVYKNHSKPSALKALFAPKKKMKIINS